MPSRRPWSIRRRLAQLRRFADKMPGSATTSRIGRSRRAPRSSSISPIRTCGLVVTLACLHYGLIPFIVMDPRRCRAEVDYDFVIGSLSPHNRDVPLDLVIDQTVLQGRLSDPVLRDFPALADDDILFIATTGGTTGLKRSSSSNMPAPFRDKVLQRNSYIVELAGRSGRIHVGDVTSTARARLRMLELAARSFASSGSGREPQTLQSVAGHRVAR